MVKNEPKYITLDKTIKSFITKKLIDWYHINQRDLPWRNTNNPYNIWISEIILQQTRVDQGLSYYLRFIERFPDIQSLASADESEVLKYWQGLGYYSRARNLHTAAKEISSKYKNIFPTDYKNILSLKGVGEYTAAAIASIALNLPYPAVDGNVFRFLSRFFLINDPIDTNHGKKIFMHLANELMYTPDPGLYNQAVMEFGALQCTPVNPDCTACPLNEKCFAFIEGKVSSYPVKQNKTKTKNVYLTYFHIRYNDYTYLVKRKSGGIWQHLYEFPSIESDKPLSFSEICKNSLFTDLFPDENIYEFKLMLENKKHILSHRILYASFYEVNINKESIFLSSLFKINTKNIDNYPTHRLMELYLK